MTHRWKNGTVTTVEVNGDEITVTDEGPLITNGKKEQTYTPYMLFELIDEHNQLNRILSRAAWRAEDNAQAKED